MNELNLIHKKRNDLISDVAENHDDMANTTQNYKFLTNLAQKVYTYEVKTKNSKTNLTELKEQSVEESDGKEESEKSLFVKDKSSSSDLDDDSSD